MIQTIRNVLLGIAIVAVVIVVVALLDGAVRNFLPTLSGRSVGLTDAATILQLLAFAVAFFISGFFARRWLRGGFPLIRVVLPIAVLYVIAVFQAPYWFLCSAAYPFACAVVHSPFLIAIIFSIVGYSARTWRSSPNVRVG